MRVRSVVSETDANSDAIEFGSFLGAPSLPTTVSTATQNISSTLTSSAGDLTGINLFSGSSAVPEVASAGSVGTSTVGSGLATKDDIMALFGPANSANAYGVPGLLFEDHLSTILILTLNIFNFGEVYLFQNPYTFIAFSLSNTR